MRSISPENYKPTSIYRNLVATKTINQTNVHEESKYIPNFTTTGKTWDVRHLDKFLNTSAWAQNSPANSPRAHRATDFSSGSPISGFKSMSPKGNTLKASFFMSNDPRDSKIQQKEYMLNIFRDFGSKGVRTDINTLALMSETDPQITQNHYSGYFSPYEKKFDPSKLEFANQPSPFMTPKQRQEQVQDIKANQAEFEKWNGRIKELTKRNRVYKNGYKSGILGVDGPLNSHTLMFREENDKFLTKQKDTETIENRRKKQLDTWTGSNSAVEFLNRKFNEDDVKPPKTMVEKNVKRHVDLPHVEAWKDSRARLFGEVNEKVSEQRRNHLIEMDNRGRNWNIITARVDKVPTK